MDVRRAIFERRSIRSFHDRPVDKELLIKLVEAAIWAPSGSNIQPWHFIAVSCEEQKARVKAFAPGLTVLPPAMLVICTDMDLCERKGGRLGRDVLSLMDAAFAAENINLMAVELGLGTCVIRSFNQAAVQEVLRLPRHLVPQLIISVGYPKKIPVRPRRRDVAEVLSWEGYG
ncbi:nitroreductase [Thermacetogenium phaeum DSM 12270]|uniref:Nitroreductase n=1 Tax=Thermacetogenium phaeum (strain ATCC BAA-254 / DSM 26808 / PB) TaxID=1089553 RepID=K4LV58_THEPS|nr:nitroreductase family protein [Thermacetogenium phaeum]AFV11909.1 nitroreductase [Thermacetogenium phaeum DSM 12270]